MNNKKHFIAIDVAKKTLDIAIHKHAQQQVYLKVSNDLKAITAFQKKAKDLKIDLENALFCMEYNGIYNYIFLDFLSSKNYAICLENALAIKRSLGFQRAKSDKIDAKRMAQYAYRFKDKAQRWIADRAAIRKLKALVSIREPLIKSRDSIAKPLKDYKTFMPESYKMFKESCKTTLQGAEKGIKAVEKQIQAFD